MKCEYPGCNKECVCFHYCAEHHRAVCVQDVSRPTPPAPDAAIAAAAQRAAEALGGVR